MMLKAILSFSLILLILFPLFASAIPGGWEPIPNVKDPHVIRIGEFAVTEYNKKSKTTFKFQSVLRGETQVVSGMLYKLTLAVNTGIYISGAGEIKNYEAIVLEKPLREPTNMSLTSFKPVRGGRFL